MIYKLSSVENGAFKVCIHFGIHLRELLSPSSTRTTKHFKTTEPIVNLLFFGNIEGGRGRSLLCGADQLEQRKNEQFREHLLVLVLVDCGGSLHLISGNLSY